MQIFKRRVLIGKRTVVLLIPSFKNFIYPLCFMRNLGDTIHELNSLIVLYMYEEALDKFYDENIVIHENEDAPVVGLSAYKERAKKIFYNNVSNYSAKLLNVIVSNELTACEWHYQFDHKIWGHWDKIQLSVQRWKDGKIIHERHYYDKNFKTK